MCHPSPENSHTTTHAACTQAFRPVSNTDCTHVSEGLPTSLPSKSRMLKVFARPAWFESRIPVAMSTVRSALEPHRNPPNARVGRRHHVFALPSFSMFDR